jgi:cytochrome b6-f complex iron-sulfur subunit
VENDGDAAMSLNRRDFLVLATATATAGCQSQGSGDASTAAPSASSVSLEQIVDAGPAIHYEADGVYARFRDRGFFIVRSGGRLFALSAVCTHRACNLDPVADHSFYCKCHGSTFDPDGKVTAGPAKLDMPRLTTSVGDQGQLLVHIPVS